MNSVFARQLILRHGWNSTAYQILNPGIDHWFNAGGTALIGYTRRHGFLLVAGGPVCAPGDLAAVARDFEDFARSVGCRVCYVCAEDRLKNLFLNSPEHATVAAGEQPVWRPGDWPTILGTHASLRRQLNRARNKGIHIEEVSAVAAAGDPEFQTVLGVWLSGRQLPPMHFLVEPEVLRGAVEDRLVMAAKLSGRVVAYLIASPVPARNGYFIEELARLPQAPNGTTELLIDFAMRRFAQERRDYVTMGLVALARDSFRTNPWWLRTLMGVARAHANRFYNFRGIERFRAKMQPDRWDKVWFISNEKYFSVKALYAVGSAFSGISPFRAIGLAVIKAAACEIRTLASGMGPGIE
jgi:phosphatidylglycerol lysyltransferase